MSFDDSQAPFTDGDVEISGYFEENFNYGSSNTACAISSLRNENSDYLYHWQREVTISIHILQYTSPNKSTFDKRFQNYVEW